MRYNYNSIITVERQVDINANQSDYTAVVGVQYRGYFAPSALTMSVGPVEAASQQYLLITDGQNDIREGDRLTIDGEVYGVKGVARYRQLQQYILNCTLQKKLKDLAS